MSFLMVYGRLYRECAERTVAGLRKNAWTLVLPVPLFWTWILLAGVSGFLGGMIGGILMALILDGLVSCYLYFTGEVVSMSRVRINELRRSIGAYFWSVVNLNFLLFIVNYLLDLLLRGNPNARYGYLLVHLLMAVLLNPAPEVIYISGTYGGVATIQRSIAFIQANWIEWFVPNLAFGAIAYFTLPLLMAPQLAIVSSFLLGALVHVAMVFRGHLFKALDGTSHRQRMYRYRAAR
jgi:hypothetical protein